MSDVDSAPQQPPCPAGNSADGEPCSTSCEGVDLTLIRQLRAMTLSERAEALKIAANNLIEARKHVRRL